MKIALVGVTGVPLGKHKVRDPRLDQADKLVKADSKVYASVDVVGEEEASTADALVVSPEGRFELVVKDLEFAETRLARNPPAPEKAVLEKIKAHLEGEGLVAEAGEDPEYGTFVLLQHAEEYQSMYGHLSRLVVRAGQRVSAGEVIGLSGNTGNSSAPHLHFEIRKKGLVVDPLTLVKEGT